VAKKVLLRQISVSHQQEQEKSYAAASLITTFTITKTEKEHHSKPNGIDWRTGYISSYNVTLSFCQFAAFGK
jgi:hypothetical protein